MADLDTGQQTRLTRDGRNGHPQWSASGEWIAYYKDDKLWVVWVSTGQEIPISEVPVQEFAWSPTEDQLAYFSLSLGLLMWEPGRRDSKMILDPKEGFINHLAWDFTGGRLAWECENGGERHLQVFSMGKAATTLFTAEGMNRVPRLAGWSIDDQWLLAWIGPASALAQADGLPLCLIPATGGPPRCLEQKMLLYADWLSWSPVGQLAFISGGGRETWVNKGLAIVDPASLTVRQLIDPAEQAPIQPAFSPDGKYLAYSAGPPTPVEAAYAQRDTALAQRHIHVIDLSSGQRRQLTNDDHFRDERPLWSYDGRHILFVRLGEQGTSLWLMDAGGSHLRPVVSELTPKPDPMGEYGHVNWQALWDWWRPSLKIR
ncbi:MAG: PD40 domain-containing protein [Thermoflexales bacterium]|nr:PD40 domain-containing protein [Thermoflexales bacterium]